LGRLFVAFVKTIIASKYNSFGKLLVFKQLDFNYARASLSTMMDIVDPKDPIRVLSCGPKNMRPLIAYTPFKDLNVGDFVVVRSHDPNLVPL
jgi:hypothetical protein